MNNFTQAMADRIKSECDKRNLSQEELFVRLETNHGWRPIDCIRWVKYGQLSLIKIRDLTESIGCSMEDLLPLPEGATAVRINCGTYGCSYEVVYPAGDSLTNSLNMPPDSIQLPIEGNKP